MTLPANFIFSQGSLQDYTDCPRRFQLRYILRRAWPAVEAEPALENERHLQLGAAFHRLAQQHILGIPPDRLSSTVTDENLSRWWHNYLTSTPANLPQRHHPEVILSAPVSRHRLIARYDLIAVEPGERAVIVDWKTSTRRPRRKWLAERLQTRVYPYLLVRAGSHLNQGLFDGEELHSDGEELHSDGEELHSDGEELHSDGEELHSSPSSTFGSATPSHRKKTSQQERPSYRLGRPFQPEQVEMVYWFANFPEDPERFHYDAAQFEADADYLASLIEEIAGLGDEDFPLTAREQRCRYCVYRSLCQRGVGAGALDEAEDEAEWGDEFDLALDFEQIAEVEY